MSIEKIEALRVKLQASLDTLISNIGKVQIGSPQQFPLGWRNAAKGRTVWRILEELITQNLEKDYVKLGIEKIAVSDSEVSVYDFAIQYDSDPSPIYVNIKSAVAGGKIQKDDISKGAGLIKFYEVDPARHFFVATFLLDFNADMTISIKKCVVFPAAWIPDIYINPSNNANLQSSKCKDLANAEKRTTSEFLELLKEAVSVAKDKNSSKGTVLTAVDKKAVKAPKKPKPLSLDFE